MLNPTPSRNESDTFPEKMIRDYPQRQGAKQRFSLEDFDSEAKTHLVKNKFISTRFNRLKMAGNTPFRPMHGHATGKLSPNFRRETATLWTLNGR